jgi:hypothetical protein
MRGANNDASASFLVGDCNEDSGNDSLDVDAGYNDDELEIIESLIAGWDRRRGEGPNAIGLKSVGVLGLASDSSEDAAFLRAERGRLTPRDLRLGCEDVTDRLPQVLDLNVRSLRTLLRSERAAHDQCLPARLVCELH